MKPKERLLVYPYDLHFTPVLRHRALLAGYEISALVSPKGWGLCGKDAGQADGGEPLGMEVGSDFNGELERCDTVLFTGADTEIDSDRLVFPKMMTAAEADKNIICTRDLQEEKSAELSKLCSQKGGYLKYFNSPGRGAHSQDVKIDSEQVYKMKTPVVYVMGLTERTHKFEIQLSLREHFLDMGYKVGQVGSRHYCELLGFHSFPDFMLDKGITESNKVVLLNHFIKGIEINEAPDVIIVGIPGGVMPMNEMFTNRFGILAFEACQAIEPDAAVFSTLYGDFKEEYFEKLLVSVKYKFGFDLTCFNIANQEFDWYTSKLELSPVYTTIDSKLADKKKEKYSGMKVPVYDILNREDSRSMADCIIDRLAGYGEVETL